ncbi:MAG: hypothetical protein ACP5E4_00725 [Candidatus Aenigmatarchaeota archaeon]
MVSTLQIGDYLRDFGPDAILVPENEIPPFLGEAGITGYPGKSGLKDIEAVLVDCRKAQLAKYLLERLPAPVLKDIKSGRFEVEFWADALSVEGDNSRVWSYYSSIFDAEKCPKRRKTDEAAINRQILNPVMDEETGSHRYTVRYLDYMETDSKTCPACWIYALMSKKNPQEITAKVSPATIENENMLAKYSVIAGWLYSPTGKSIHVNLKRAGLFQMVEGSSDCRVKPIEERSKQLEDFFAQTEGI